MPMPSNEARRNLLPNEPIESFWDALWLGIQPFLCSIVQSWRITCRCLQTKRGAISWCVVCLGPGGGFLVCGHVWEWVACGGGRHSSGRVTCDTFAPDSSSSSPACGCESCKMCTTILVKTPHHRACVGIMRHTFSKKPSSSSDIVIRRC